MSSALSELNSREGNEPLKISFNSWKCNLETSFRYDEHKERNF